MKMNCQTNIITVDIQNLNRKRESEENQRVIVDELTYLKDKVDALQELLQQHENLKPKEESNS